MPPPTHVKPITTSFPTAAADILSTKSGTFFSSLFFVADDGKLSFEEFKAYFADGILTTDELQELFYSIDGRQANNLDTDKLSDYFSQHLGEYLNVLSALEKLNVAILKAMDKTKEEYQGSSVLGQFVTRFMLKETSSQLLSLQMSLQCAMEAVEEQSSPAP
uniref:N-terminal EF-hand calcium binding protein 3 n=1 Tax=Astyanax mexicanus TaxID=7994 RepID=A0A8B9L5L4_ASTMX